MRPSRKTKVSTPSSIRLPPPSAPNSRNRMSSSKRMVLRSQVACGSWLRTPANAWRMLSLPRSTPAGVMKIASSLKSATISSRSSAPSACTWWSKTSWGLRVAATWPLLSVAAAASLTRRSQQIPRPGTRGTLGDHHAGGQGQPVSAARCPWPRPRQGSPWQGGCRAGLACRGQRAWGLLGCGSGGIVEGEDLWPDLREAAVKGAAGDRPAAFLVVDGHLDPGDDLIGTAEARLAWPEPDQHSTPPAELGPPVAERHLPAGDRRQAMAEQLQRARLAVVPRHHDVGAVRLPLDVSGQLRPAHLVLVVAAGAHDTQPVGGGQREHRQ